MPQPYKHLTAAIVRRIADVSDFSIAPSTNPDYLRWQAEGGDAVTDPADPPPIRYAGRDDREHRVQTSGTTPGELVRFTLTTQTGYVAVVEVIGIDAGNGVMKRLLFASTFKRLNGGALAVGTKTDLASHQDGGAAATTAGVANWTITPGLDGNDATITVVGHTGRTVDWFAFVTLRRFRPAGVQE